MEIHHKTSAHITQP